MRKNAENNYTIPLDTFINISNKKEFRKSINNIKQMSAPIFSRISYSVNEKKECFMYVTYIPFENKLLGEWYIHLNFKTDHTKRIAIKETEDITVLLTYIDFILHQKQLDKIYIGCNFGLKQKTAYSIEESHSVSKKLIEVMPFITTIESSPYND